MKKKGFTLIELLAVIVILAIIALIATPIVMNVIENAKKGAAERSAENYVNAIATVVATERLDGNVLEGDYTIQKDGSLCKGLNVTNCLEEEKIEVDMSGNKPKSGTIYIENGIVNNTSTMGIGDYTVSYDSTKKIYVASQGPTESYICEKTGEESKTVGAQYKCDLATPEADTTFYVLGENLIDTTKIDLIMDRNFIDDVVPSTLAWCIDGKTDSTSCQNINSTEEGTPLKHIQDKFGNNVQVSFPTKAQLENANNGSSKNLPQWLYDYLVGTKHSVSGVYAYWTASPFNDFAGYTAYAWLVNSYGNLKDLEVNNTEYYGIRPVITISKNQLN